MNTRKSPAESAPVQPDMLPPEEPPIGNGLDADAVPPATVATTTALDDLEALERSIIIDDDDDRSASDAEPEQIEITDRMPQFRRFRVNPDTSFEAFGVIDAGGMDKALLVATRDFAPVLEEEVPLRRVRFYETTTDDAEVRLLYCFLPDKDARNPNLWLTSKIDGMELAKGKWVTMQSRKNEGRYKFRACRKQDRGDPIFSGLTRGGLVDRALRQPGLLIENESHTFYRRAADLDDDE